MTLNEMDTTIDEKKREVMIYNISFKKRLSLCFDLIRGYDLLLQDTNDKKIIRTTGRPKLKN